MRCSTSWRWRPSAMSFHSPASTAPSSCAASMARAGASQSRHRCAGAAARVTGPLNPYHLGFLVGPRINAGGRIGDAASRHAAARHRRRARGAGHRRAPQRAQQRAPGDRARCGRGSDPRRRAEIGGGDGPPVLVLASANWHAGVVGLVAARLRERFERPAFAIALNPDGTGTGSGRSMPGVDLGRAVIAAVEADIIQKGGGHAMAAGVTSRRPARPLPRPSRARRWLRPSPRRAPTGAQDRCAR